MIVSFACEVFCALARITRKRMQLLRDQEALKKGWSDRHQPSDKQEKSDQAGRCHRIGQGGQKPQYAASQAQRQLSCVRPVLFFPSRQVIDLTSRKFHWSPYEPRGRAFESLRARQICKGRQSSALFQSCAPGQIVTCRHRQSPAGPDDRSAGAEEAGRQCPSGTDPGRTRRKAQGTGYPRVHSHRRKIELHEEGRRARLQAGLMCIIRFHPCRNKP